jgi:hypothetical protein
MEVPQNPKNRTAIRTELIQQYQMGIYLKNVSQECMPMFITALFIIAKLWKQPRCPTTDEWIKKGENVRNIYIHTHNEILLSYKEE